MSNDKIVLIIQALDEKDAETRAEREFAQLAGGRHRFDILELEAAKDNDLKGWGGYWKVTITYKRWGAT